MIKDSVAFRLGIQALIVVALAGAIFVSAILGGFALFKTYTGTFDRLLQRDTVTAQQLYNDTVARQIKDTLLEQQNQETNVELAAESITREAGFWELYWAILNETEARIAEEAIIAAGIANETAARVPADAYISAEIANLTAMVETAEAYEQFSIAKFMIIMQNITDMLNALNAETDARIAADLLLTEQGTLADATIAYLTTTLEHDIHDRMVQDVLIDEWISALQVLGTGILTINGVPGNANHNLDIVSTNNLTTITAPAPGSLVFTNNAVRTLQGVTADGADNIVLTVQSPLNIVAAGPHLLHVYSTSVPIGPNSILLTGYSAGSPAYSLTPAMFPSANPYYSPFCNFPSYNGGTCGWSATDTGTYIVHVEATLTMMTEAESGLPGSAHITMGLTVGTFADFLVGAWDFVEGSGGSVRSSDGCYSGNGEVIDDYTWDMGLTATTIVQGPGSPGCWASCGYGVWPSFKTYIHHAKVMAVSITYRVTKVP